MARTYARTAVATLAAVLAVGLAACGNGGAETTTDPTAANSSATPDETPTPAPTVSAATGLKLSEKTAMLRVPEGWVERQEPLVNWASAVNGPGRGETIVLSDNVSLAGPYATVDGLARSAIKVRAKGAKFKRLPDVDLDGRRGYLIRFTEPGFPDLSYDICTLRHGRVIGIEITLDIKNRRKHMQVVKSVLASFRWKD